MAGLGMTNMVTGSVLAPSSALGANDRITVALIGARSMGWGDLQDILKQPEVVCKTLCRITSYNVCYTKLLRGGANSGIDGGNDNGKGITDTPEGLKLQAEGHPVLYRNIWIKELDLKEADTDF